MATNELSLYSKFVRIVRNDLIQLHCEDVSWERASDKIHLNLVRYLLEYLVQYLSTLVFLRGNRCLFLIEWPQVADSAEAEILANSFGNKTYLEEGHYKFTYMLSYVGPKYEDLVKIYCHVHWGQPMFGNQVMNTLMNTLNFCTYLQVCQGLPQRKPIHLLHKSQIEFQT